LKIWFSLAASVLREHCNENLGLESFCETAVTMDGKIPQFLFPRAFAVREHFMTTDDAVRVNRVFATYMLSLMNSQAKAIGCCCGWEMVPRGERSRKSC
jgi:hypothetical protein